MIQPITKAHQCRRSAGKAAERKAKHQPAYIAALHALPCICTGLMPVEVHHILEGRMSMGGLRDDRMAVPLCSDIHREAHASGAPEQFMRDAFGIDSVLCAVRLWQAWVNGDSLVRSWAGNFEVDCLQRVPPSSEIGQGGTL